MLLSLNVSCMHFVGHDGTFLIKNYYTFYKFNLVGGFAGNPETDLQLRWY